MSTQLKPKMRTQLKPGDFVKVLDGSKEVQYAGGWVTAMESYVGKFGVVEEINKYSSGSKVRIEGFPFVWDLRYLEKTNNYILPILPKRILRTKGATIVFWEDGTKTVVKPTEDEHRNDFDAFTAALAKKIYGSTSAVCRIVAKTEVGDK